MRTNLLILLALHLGLAAVVAQPVITNQPQSQTNIVGATVTFSVGATGTPPLSYQWVFNNIGNRLPGATNDTLVLPNIQASNAGIYRVVITNSAGSVQSGSARLTVASPPTITAEPADQNAVAGESASLGVVASGTVPLAYQWYFNGEAHSGATASNFVLASVQSSNVGPYQVIITNRYGAVTSQVVTLTVVPATLFIRVTNDPVVTTLGQSPGAIWADLDNDGFLDLYVAQYGVQSTPNPNYRSATNHLFHNNGNGSFTRVAHADFLVNGNYNLGVSAADYDNDGWLDFVVTTGGSAPTPRPTMLFHNNGDATFTRTSGGGITNELGWFPSAQWADYDNDGFVDLLITQSDATESGSYTNLLWHNNGDGTFGRVLEGPLVNDRMSGWGLQWSDYDNDGFSDVYVMSSANGHNYLYHNTGGGTFTRITNSVVTTDSYGFPNNQSADWGDYNNDGLMDLFVPNDGIGKNHLYHNDGSGRFSNVATVAMLTPPAGAGSGRSVAWGDYDNDGFLDLLVGYSYRNLIYRNNHDGTFTEIKSISPAVDPLPESGYFFNTRGWVDYDNDGFLDLYLCGGSFSNLQLPNFLYHNAGNSNAWLEVKCVGTIANRAAIGAKIRIKATIGGETFWQMRELSSGGAFLLAKPLVAHFGLGDATNVETLRIEWPSGTVQELHNVALKQILKITEPPRLLASKTNGEPQFVIKGGRGFNYQIDTSTNFSDWLPLGTVTITNLNGTAPILDTNAPGTHGFYRAVGR